ncbi:MAG: hypothetical protein A2Y95_04190 [Deltaproteobacteria bacterium RBG_13_65_10]|nr:MAG: hypothetical protein A2Y95_04190 [Deltaproteobacteria bacterium RBG_13_65_10]
MTDLGFYTLVITFVLAAYAGIASIIGYRSGLPALIASGRRSVYLVAGTLTLSILILFHAFAVHDFTLQYVADHSNRALPWPYAISALWAGQEGSLLFWVWILSIYTAAVTWSHRGRQKDLMPTVVAVLSLNVLFFVYMLLFVAGPFEKLPSFNVPPDGRGLNPLLQHPAMMIHPPCLYIGYVGLAVPFAFAVAALVTGKLDDGWIRTTRRWMLFPWAMLGIGILLGGRWAYVELGWGGYWAWDPVENASLMPWLAGTAYLHSVMIQEKRNMMKFWNHFLVALTFLLSLVGTFITRSGIISSVHSFALSDIGPYFSGYMLVVAAFTAVMFFVRREKLRAESTLDSYLSRESAFLLNNLILLGACFAVLWGTLFPILSEAIRGVKITVGPPWFNEVNVPIGLILLALTGIGPMIAWRRASLANLRSMFIVPTALGLVTGVGLRLAGLAHGYALVSFALAMFVIIAILQEFWRGVAARRRQFRESVLVALKRLIDKNRRRYGGYVVHVGIVSIFVGLTGTAFNVDREATLKPGQTVELRDYTLRFQGLESGRNPNYEWAKARFNVYKGTRHIVDMVPSKNFYIANQQPTTEVSIHTSLREDLYLALAAVHEDGSVTFKLFINPLVQWIWIGGCIFAFGTLIVMWPDPMDRRYLIPKYA